MTEVITNVGRDFIEDKTLNQAEAAIIDKIAIGDSSINANVNDTAMNNELYSASTASANVLIERTATDGELRFVITVTGGTEVPANAELREFGILTDTDILIYHENRVTAEVIQSGETLTFEIRLRIKDPDPTTDHVFTTVGINYVADRLIGQSSEYINTVSIGDSTNNTTQADTTMFNPLYTADESDPNVTVDTTTNVGETDIRISVSAGPDFDDEVSAGANISEFGVLTDANTLVVHETRSAVTLQGGDSQTFKIPVDIKKVL